MSFRSATLAFAAVALIASVSAQESITTTTQDLIDFCALAPNSTDCSEINTKTTTDSTEEEAATTTDDSASTDDSSSTDDSKSTDDADSKKKAAATTDEESSTDADFFEAFDKEFYRIYFNEKQKRQSHSRPQKPQHRKPQHHKPQHRKQQKQKKEQKEDKEEQGDEEQQQVSGHWKDFAKQETKKIAEDMARHAGEHYFAKHNKSATATELSTGHRGKGLAPSKEKQEAAKANYKKFTKDQFKKASKSAKQATKQATEQDASEQLSVNFKDFTKKQFNKASSYAKKTAKQAKKAAKEYLNSEQVSDYAF